MEKSFQPIAIDKNDNKTAFSFSSQSDLDEEESDARKTIHPSAKLKKFRKARKVSNSNNYASSKENCNTNFLDGSNSDQELEPRDLDIVLSQKFSNSKKSNKYKCLVETCNATFTTLRNRSSHMYKVHAPPITCPWNGCDKTIQKRHLNRHIQSVHLRTKSTCEDCGKKIDKFYLTQHKTRCLKVVKSEFPCLVEGCDAVFKASSNRRYHMKNVHSAPTKCPYANCGKKIKLNNLDRHIKNIHQNKTLLTCDHCHRKMGRKHLIVHLKKCEKNNF